MCQGMDIDDQFAKERSFALERFLRGRSHYGYVDVARSSRAEVTIDRRDGTRTFSIGIRRNELQFSSAMYVTSETLCRVIPMVWCGKLSYVETNSILLPYPSILGP
jgi:hypothetical protein